MTQRSTLVAGLIGGLIGSTPTLGGAYLVDPPRGATGPTGPRGIQGPAGPAGTSAVTDEAPLADTASASGLGGTYVIEDVVGPHLGAG